MSDRLMQYILQIVVALALIALAVVHVIEHAPIPEWITTAIIAVVGVLFGLSAANGFNNYRKTKK